MNGVASSGKNQGMVTEASITHPAESARANADPPSTPTLVDQLAHRHALAQGMADTVAPDAFGQRQPPVTSTGAFHHRTYAVPGLRA